MNLFCAALPIILHKSQYYPERKGYFWANLKKLKTLTLALFFILFAISLFAQKVTDSLPAYKSIPTIPPFKLMLVPDSTAFTKYDLKKKKLTVIFIFSPDCDHCLHATEDLLANYKQFKKAQIVMATSLSFPHVQKFYRDFKIAEYPNIKVGLDNTYFLNTFYNVKSYPAIFVYDKKGKFKAAFDSGSKFEKIAQAL